MKIGGLQKFSLIDYPSKIACTIFLSGCNFRCGFCHNPELVFNKEENFSEKEILDFLEKRKGKLEGVCITGGEPLFDLDLDFLEEIKKKNYLIKMDTNGSYPTLLKELIERKLIDYVALDIKAEKEKYNLITNSKVDINKIEESLKLISRIDYEVRTTAIRGYNDLEEIGKWLDKFKIKKYVIQNFTSRDKLIDNKFKEIKQYNNKELEYMKSKIEKYFEKVEFRD